MRRTEHKKEEELIAHIRHTLQRHEEAYTPGAWERFNEKPLTRKRPLLWVARLSGAAAVLIVGFALFWYTSPETAQQPIQNAALKSSAQPQPAGENQVIVGHDPATNGQQVVTRREPAGNYESNSSRLIAYAPVSPGKNSLFSNDADVASTRNDVATPAGSNSNISLATGDLAGTKNTDGITESLIAQADSPKGTTDFLAEESRKAETDQNKLAINGKSKKWSMALMLAPSFGNTNELNLGYGVSMSYRFSDRFSVHSGIAYNKMNASKNFQTNIGMSPVVLSNARSLEMISEEVTGIDVPLELRYHLNKNFYANMGVSGFAVLNQHRNNTFVQEVVVKSGGSNTVATSASGGIASSGDLQDAFGPKGQFANTYITSQRTTEKVAPAALNRVNYLGFYNLSVGYTRRIYKNNTLSFEPFVKLPVNGATDDLRMMGKGVRLKVGF